MAKLSKENVDANKVIALGSDAYYWRAVTAQFQTMIVISAHGGIKKSAAADLTVNQGKLLYYVDHGVVQSDFGIGKFASPVQPAPVETVNTGGKTYNYDLSKYQGRHGNVAETYQAIQQQSTNAERHNDTIANLTDAERAMMGGNITGQQALFDVVTVRNRNLSGGTTLKKVLAQIAMIRGGNPVIHCFFCRSFY